MSVYWTVSEGKAARTGWSCRECKKIIQKNEDIFVRDGRKMRFFYHKMCYSGDADPRTQQNSSFDISIAAFQEKAPPKKGVGKWSTTNIGYNPR